MTELGVPAGRIVSKGIVQRLDDLAKTEYGIEDIAPIPQVLIQQP